MLFRLDSWLARRAIHSAFRRANHAVTKYQIANPYHAVSVRSGQGCCAAAAQLQEQRFLSTEATYLPLANCSSDSCSCVYQHHDDRRSGVDRRDRVAVVRRDRRRGLGRRHDNL